MYSVTRASILKGFMHIIAPVYASMLEKEKAPSPR